MITERGNFGSRLGIVLATAGSAVGLGNVWRFPYMTGQNGGAAFIIIYLLCILFLGIPGMVSEFIVGRHSQTNAARAYASFSHGKAWGLVGILGILTSTIILGFYAVVAGWCLHYLGASIIGQLRCAQWHRACLQTADAATLHPIADHCDCLLLVAWCFERNRVSA